MSELFKRFQVITLIALGVAFAVEQNLLSGFLFVTSSIVYAWGGTRE